MNDLLICVPCRYHSTRLPGKPLLKINDLSIINHVYLNILKINGVCGENIVFLTDDKRIYDEVTGFRGFCYISDDYCENGTYRIIDYMEKNKINKKYVLNIQGDEPFFDFKKVENLIKFYLDEHKRNNNVKCGTLFYINDDYKYVSNKNRVKLVINRQNYVMYGSRSVIPGSKKNMEAIVNNEKLMNLIENETGKNDVTKMNDYLGSLMNTDNKNNKNNKKYEKEKKCSIEEKIKYKIHIGIFIFDTEYLMHEYVDVNTCYQTIEDLEWLKILEQNYLIYAIQSHQFEVGVDTLEDYNYLKNKYQVK